MIFVANRSKHVNELLLFMLTILSSVSILLLLNEMYSIDAIIKWVRELVIMKLSMNT
jgi:hypothetical protein